MLTDEQRKVLTESERRRKMLEKHQYCIHGHCPECDEVDGHKPDCELAELVKEA